MSLRPQVFYLVPEDTARVARAANPKGNIYLRMYDAFGTIFTDHQFASLFPVHGQPALAPVRLALTTLMQFAEGLTDRQAADAVRTRLDWKYLLCLELTDPGFHFSVLSAFRERLIAGGVEHLLLDTLLQHCRELGLLKARGTQRTDSTHVLAAVRSLNRLERVGETLRAALNSVAVVAPTWLQEHVPVDWYERYADRVDNARFPKTERERTALATTIGQDGRTLLAWVDDQAAPLYLRELPAIQILRQVWHDQYTEPPEPVSLRSLQSLPPSSQQIATPYDPDARYSTKRSVEWVGYKVHLTETCDAERPCLITHVETTVATVPDDQVVAPIHRALISACFRLTTSLMRAIRPRAISPRVPGPIRSICWGHWPRIRAGKHEEVQGLPNRIFGSIGKITARSAQQAWRVVHGPSIPGQPKTMRLWCIGPNAIVGIVRIGAIVRNGPTSNPVSCS